MLLARRAGALAASSRAAACRALPPACAAALMPLSVAPLLPPLAAAHARAASSRPRVGVRLRCAAQLLARPASATLPTPRGALLVAGARRAASAPAKPPADAPAALEAPPAADASDPAALFGGWDALPGREWDAVQRWVVFSDLHVSARTEAVCLEVLSKARAPTSCAALSSRSNAITRRCWLLRASATRACSSWATSGTRAARCPSPR